jgi:hypothetical protein
VNILDVIAPSKAPPVADDDEELDEVVDESDAEFCFAPLHAAASDVIKSSVSRKVVSEDWGISLIRETADRIIEHPFLICPVRKNGEASARIRRPLRPLVTSE